MDFVDVVVVADAVVVAAVAARRRLQVGSRRRNLSRRRRRHLGLLVNTSTRTNNRPRYATRGDRVSSVGHGS